MSFFFAPVCGDFEITGPAISRLEESSATDRAKLSGWLYDRKDTGDVPNITADALDEICALPRPSLDERGRRFLREAIRNTERLGERFNIYATSYMVATYSADRSEVKYLAQMLAKEGYVLRLGAGGTCQLSPEGYRVASEAGGSMSESEKVFVAMWFTPELDDAYRNGFVPGIMEARYSPIRVDQVEHVNRIDDEVIAQIRTSAFVVADFTGHRTGVYFEAGFALGLGLSVIWTCRKSDLGDLHFDIRQYNCIDWETPEELAERLQRRIEEVVGKGST
ncbi:hypothetical protein [Candidatus Palauibacter sp.]|uniref:hypothetical protein n=1 Tax=Candidatus Palauibacter sp. TaxID=3101350 RepID=UPI003B51CEE0